MESDFIAEYLCRAGGHAARNWTRGGGPAYAEVVYDVCRAIKAIPSGTSRDVLLMENALLMTLFKKALEGLSPPDQEKYLKAMAAAAGRPISLDDVFTGGKLIIVLMPMILEVLGQQVVRKGLAVAVQAVVGPLAGALVGPVGLAAAALWIISDIAGPSLRGTVPAVAQVAILRQRYIWKDL